MSAQMVTGTVGVALPPGVTPVIGQVGGRSGPAAAAFDQLFVAELLKESHFVTAGSAGAGDIWNDVVRELLAGQIAQGQVLGFGASLIDAERGATTREDGHDR